MAPVGRIARFMETLDASHLSNAFADRNVTIIENFAPYVFAGPGAARRWEKGFRSHAQGLCELRHVFGEPRDFSLQGGRAYYSMPTTWTGRSNGKPFSENGGWAFVLSRKRRSWRVQSYAWAVTSYSLLPKL